MTVHDSALSRFPRIAACGDSAIVVELSDQIDEATSLLLRARLRANALCILSEKP